MKAHFITIPIAAIILTLSAQDQKTGTFTDPRDGRIYKTVSIGTQTWMAENFAFEADSGCWALYDITDFVDRFGYLYSWECAKKICPAGWHLPSDDEWRTLINYMGGDTIAGGKLKEPGNDNWKDPNTGATNSVGFRALGAGYRSYSGTYYDSHNTSRWWSSNGDGYRANFFYINYNSANIKKGDNQVGTGFSVRYVKNQ
jgi:uncharacterized protein (TIGR02145 family)